MQGRGSKKKQKKKATAGLVKLACVCVSVCVRECVCDNTERLQLVLFTHSPFTILSPSSTTALLTHLALLESTGATLHLRISQLQPNLGLSRLRPVVCFDVLTTSAAALPRSTSLSAACPCNSQLRRSVYAADYIFRTISGRTPTQLPILRAKHTSRHFLRHFLRPFLSLTPHTLVLLGTGSV